MKLDSALTSDRVAKIIGGSYTGNPDFLITGLNEIHMVESGDLTFVDHPKYYDKALCSKATTIIINKQMSPPEGKTLIFSDDPFAAYMTLVRLFRPFEKSNLNISPSAEIGEGTVIQPGAFVGNGVKIGRNCIIHSNVSIYDNCQLGDRVIIHSGSVIGADAYYFQRKPEGYRKFESCGRVVIGDDVEIGALCSVDKGVSGDTTISNSEAAHRGGLVFLKILKKNRWRPADP